jgi:hypothetical protein
VINFSKVMADRSHPRRNVAIAVAAAGAAISIYLACYQVGIVSNVWEPFFGDGSRIVLHSRLSRALPIPDAAVGALGYIAEAILGARGRLNEHVGSALVLGAIAVAMAGAGICLAAYQIFVLATACTLCLSSAALSLAYFFFVLPEVRAAWRDRGVYFPHRPREEQR